MATRRSTRRKTSASARRVAKRPAKQKVSARVVSKTSRRKNPRGGLTAAGRDYFRQKQGAHLKPGVMKSRSEMSPQEMRRKGSWAVRFYGRTGKLPPLKDEHGKPTRFALTAAAWGEPVPKTVAAARRIAAKGRKLLDAYERSKR